MERRNIPIALKKIIVDFELAIQMSALSVFDQLVILGCFFHFGQCLLRKIQSSRMVSTYKSNESFSKLVRRCISLPFLRLNKIQDTIDQLHAVEIDDTDVEDTWVDGTYPPHTWNYHGRNNENTNNVLERYNGILNRLIQVQHPNAYVLVSHFITEICSANETIERCLEGKVPVAKRSIYVKLGEERKELQKRYLKGLISRMDFLLRMGFKLIKSNQEYRRKRPEEQILAQMTILKEMRTLKIELFIHLKIVKIPIKVDLLESEQLLLMQTLGTGGLRTRNVQCVISDLLMEKSAKVK